MVMAWASLKLHDFAKHRWYLIATFLLSGLFLVNKYFEYADHFARGEGPSHSTFLAIYFTLTGLHGLHIIGGMVVMAYFIGPGAALWRKTPEQFTNRIEYTGLYWHFVDLVWIFLFPVLICCRRENSVRLQADRGGQYAFRCGKRPKQHPRLLKVGAALRVYRLTVAANQVHLAYRWLLRSRC
jgi:hypothetical protein